MADESRPVGSHGQPLVEAMSRDADPSNRDGKYRYVVLPPTVDFAAKALSDVQEGFRKEHPDYDMSVLRWSVQKKMI